MMTKSTSSGLRWPALATLACAGLCSAQAQDSKSFFPPGEIARALAGVHPPCKAKLQPLVTDTVFEGVKTTSFNWSSTAGGGESGRYDKVPVLTTRVKLGQGCLNAHLSAMVGSAQTYPGVSSITMFQVTLTNTAGVRVHMAGHYETPYGLYGPAVALSAEHDVDMLASNFYMPVGTGEGQVPPGNYRVDVWWSGGPIGGGGAIGAAFVLKLYQ